MRKAILIFSSILFLLLVVAGGAISLMKAKGTPKYEGKLHFEGLKGQVTIQYDHEGIPHIHALHEEDGFFGLGFAMAQDRLFQMDLMRRVTQGRLSEVLGEKTLEADILFRTIKFNRAFQKKSVKEAMDPHVYQQMQAFYRGVNAFIAQDKLSFEFTLLNYKPEPFEVADGLGILGYMSYSFAQAFKTDPLITQVLKEKGEDYVMGMRREPLLQAKQKTVNLPSVEGKNIWMKGHYFVEKTIGLFEGSNAWVLAPKRTTKGKTLLASDPHVGYTLPGLWYEAHLKMPTMKDDNFEIYGHFVPGVPFSAMGHKEELGWAVTINYLDDMDFITLDETVPLETSKELIKVKKVGEKVITVKDSDFGPIVSDLFKNLKHQRILYKPEALVAMRWGHHQESNRSADAFYQAMVSRNQEEFEKALSLGKSPGLNVIYGDKEGHIARYLFGTFWKRPRRMTGDIFYPYHREDLSKLEDIPFAERPHLKDPDSGVIVSANQKPENTQELKAGYFQPIDRYDTIHEILKAKEKWSLEEMRHIQTSAVDIYFGLFQKKILKAIQGKYEKGSREEKAIQVFEKWDGLSPAHSAGALIFYKTMGYFSRLLFEELSEDQYLSFCHTNNIWHIASQKLLNEKETLKLAKAFKLGVSELYKNHGGPVNWKWGQEHKLTVPHPLSGAGAVMAMLLDVGPVEMDGGHNQINNMRPVGCEDGMAVKAGPSTRRLISWSNPKESLGILPLGNSGHFNSPFFANQWERFRRGDFRKQLMRKLGKEEILHTLNLIPKE